MKTIVILLLLCTAFGCVKKTSLQFEGVVTTEATGQPLDSVTVILRKVGLNARDLVIYDEFITDPTGHYRLEYTNRGFCPASLISLKASKPGYGDEYYGFTGERILCINDLQIVDFEL